MNGNTLGATYPKRAKGLVKNGRAEYTDDQTIRMKITHAPVGNNDTEDIKMSKVIDFNAREFRFDETCQSLDGNQVNAGTRAFVTMSFGNTEVWEIGDWGWTWSQIRRDLTLDKNTDYVFRFAMEGGICNTDNAVTIAHIAPKRDLEERCSYLLDHNKFMPVVCKQDGDGLLRIFELPFNTGEDEEWIISLVAQHAVTRYFAPVSSELIAGLPDVESYSSWWDEATQKRKAERARKNAQNKAADGINMAVESQEFDEEGFAAMLSKIGDNCNIGFESVTVRSSSAGSEFSVGACTDESNLGFENCTFTSLAMSMIITKLGDGCNISFENVTVTEEGVDNMLAVTQSADEMNIALENVTIPQRVLDLIHTKLGDGCTIATENCTTI